MRATLSPGYCSRHICALDTVPLQHPSAKQPSLHSAIEKAAGMDAASANAVNPIL